MLDSIKITTIKDLLQKPNCRINATRFINKLQIPFEYKLILVNKYVLGLTDKEQYYSMNISARQFYKKSQTVHIAAYDAFKAQLRSQLLGT